MRGEYFYSLPVLAPKFADRAASFKPSDVDGEDVEVFPHQFVQQFVGRDFPVWHFDRIQRTRNDTAIKLSRHSGMDCRNPDCREATDPCHPWSLGSGGPCRNDGCVKVISNNEPTKRIVHERHERILLLFVLFVSFVDSIFACGSDS